MRSLAVFDIDGTLTRTAGVDGQCLVRAAKNALGLKDVDSDWNAYRDATDAGIIADAFEEQRGRPPLKAEVERFIVQFVSELESARSLDPSGFLEVPGAASLLRHLAATEGWFVSLATGSWAETARLKLVYAEIPFEGVPLATCSDARSREEIVRLSVQRAETSVGGGRGDADVAKDGGFDRIVMVGDGPWDVRTAAILEHPFVGVGDGEDAERLRREGAAVILSNFTNLDEVMDALSSSVPRTRGSA